MTEELKEQIHERVYNIKVPTLGFSRRDLFNIAMEYAEPREKRIAELEKENAELKSKEYFVGDINRQNMELQQKLEVKEKQIEKMKCCFNCSKWNDGQCADIPDSGYCCADFVCEDWEIKEK